MHLNTLTATDLVKKIKNKKISVEELACACLTAIASREKKIKAWEFLNLKQVLGYARALDNKGSLGALSGIPVGVKDIFNTKDMPTAMGSPIWKNFTPGNDARVVHNIRINDGLIFGKTVTAEFAVHHLPKDKTINPHKENRTPGTSSSGSAAAVAAYMVPFALGTQTAGSIIRPASYCGVYGFKPSFGVIPRTGILKTTDSLDTVGCFARSIADIRLLFEAIRVKGKNYPFVYEKLDSQKELKFSKNRKVNIGFIIKGLDVFSGFEKYAIQSFKEFLSKLAQQNKVRVSEVKPSTDFTRIHRLHGIIYDKTLAYYFQDEFKQHKLISEIMYEIIKRGNRVSNKQFIEALESQQKIKHRIDNQLSKYDIIVTLSTAGVAPLVNEKEKADTCLIWTFLGYPALSLPIFHGPENLPFGLQVIAKRYDDYKLLSISEEFLAKL